MDTRNHEDKMIKEIRKVLLDLCVQITQAGKRKRFTVAQVKWKKNYIGNLGFLAKITWDFLIIAIFDIYCKNLKKPLIKFPRTIIISLFAGD